MCVLSTDRLLLITELDNVMIIFMNYMPKQHKINVEWGCELWFLAYSFE
jgi:hypothetical protein